jgi:hypothetical protein
MVRLNDRGQSNCLKCGGLASDDQPALPFSPRQHDSQVSAQCRDFMKSGPDSE